MVSPAAGVLVVRHTRRQSWRRPICACAADEPQTGRHGFGHRFAITYFLCLPVTEAPLIPLRAGQLRLRQALNLVPLAPFS